MRWAFLVVAMLLVVGALVVVPQSAKAGWGEDCTLESVSLYDNLTLLRRFDGNVQTLEMTRSEQITQIQVVAVYGPSGSVDEMYVNLTVLSPSDVLLYSSSRWTTTAANMSIEEFVSDGNVMYRATCYYNITGNITFDTYGDYRFTISQTLRIWFLEYKWLTVGWMEWNESVFRVNLLAGVGETTYGIGLNLVTLVWVFVVFLPGLVLGIAFGKMGFVGGLILMSLALSAVGTMPPWVFLTTMIGVVVLVIKGDDET